MKQTSSMLEKAKEKCRSIQQNCGICARVRNITDKWLLSNTLDCRYR